MTQETVPPRKRSNSYNIFIFVLTLLSLGIMFVMLLPLATQTLDLLRVYDNLICIIFLIDFTYSLFSTPKKSDYFIKERGWLDLLGSIPSFGITQYGGLLRLARLSRLARIARLMKGENKKELVEDVLHNRSQYAAFLTILLTILVLTISSVLVLQFESVDPAASIKTGGDALWYSLVTITTVGYGDFYPITTAGRIAGMFIMFAGVGIIGALASLLSSVLMGGGSPAPAEENAPAAAGPSDPEVAALKQELAEMHLLLEKIASGMPVKP
ncbi:MAG: potassium channel family protein [Bacteroidota bacterium]